MKTEIERRSGGPCTLVEFADKHGLTMTVGEREGTGPNQFFAHFNRVDEMRDRMLVGTYGDGATPDEAIAAYGDKIQGKRLVYDAYRERKEFTAPNEFLPKEPTRPYTGPL